MGYRVKEERLKHLWTQEELADKSGVSRVTINAIETGKTENVLVNTLRKIADALGVSIEDLFISDDA